MTSTVIRKATIGGLYAPVRVARSGFDFLRRWPVIPAVVLGTLVISAIFADQIAPHDIRAVDLRL